MFNGEDLRVDCSDDGAELLEIKAKARFDDLVVVIDSMAHEDDWTWIAVFVLGSEDAAEHGCCFIHADEGCIAELEGLGISFAEVFVGKMGMCFNPDVVDLNT